jgi:hypothetical protein
MARCLPLALLLVVTAIGGARAQVVPPTDLRAVDEFIDAPRTLFGRTGDAVERALGAPVARRARTLPGSRPAALDPVEELVYPGAVVFVSRRSGGLRRVQITGPRWRWPRGLDVGVPRGQVEQVLGEPQAATDVSALYLYSDAYPDTVEFFFVDGRVQRIEWRYAPPD